MLGWWTLQRASGTGAVAALVAVVLWPVEASSDEPLFWLFGAAAAVAGLCGVSILLITALDIARRSRGTIMRRVRIFDIAFGALLLLLSLLQLEAWYGRLPA